MQHPEIYSMWTDEGKKLEQMCSKGTKINAMGKSLTTFSTPTLHQMEDGSVIERGVNGRGCWIYCQWPSLTAAMNHQNVSWGNPKHEQW